MEHFNHLIIGTGQASGTLLGALISRNESIAVIEKHKVGGSCVNYGCTPTKALVASSRMIKKSGEGIIYGFNAGEIKVDFPAVMKRMNSIRNESRKGLKEWIESTGNIELIQGEANFISEKAILVDGREISADKIYINVGTRPIIPPIKGIETINSMDSEKLLELSELPEHLLIIGGGYIGIEFAQIFVRLGSKVTLIQAGDQLMPKEDQDVAKEIQKIIEEEGVGVHCNARAESATANSDRISLLIKTKEETIKITGSHLLVATGRAPNSDTLTLENAGIRIDEKGYINVDDYCRTNIENVFALGDVNGQGAFTHTSVNDAEIVVDFLNSGHRKLSERIPIYALFTDPPLGRVGLSEKEALEKGYKVLKAVKPMSEISRAKEMGETKGFAKLLVDAESDKILGASIIGPGADEIINMFAAIMHSSIPCKRYREVVLVHPTVSELMPFVLDGLEPIN